MQQRSEGGEQQRWVERLRSRGAAMEILEKGSAHRPHRWNFRI